MDPLLLIFVAAIVFLCLERVFPGRSLPDSPGWYACAASLNAVQLGIVLLAGVTWNVWLQGPSLFHIADLGTPFLQGSLCWFVGTFVFYWWHRARHASDVLWTGLHQIHHSATRIETLTSFYKHPLEIALNSVLASTVVYVLLGASIEAAGWYNLFAALGEFYYHSNLRTAHWTGWLLQRPEHHSIHHQRDVHNFNFGDITLWDRLFGTFRDVAVFAPACGYYGDREARLADMLVFKDVNAG